MLFFILIADGVCVGVVFQPSNFDDRGQGNHEQEADLPASRGAAPLHPAAAQEERR